MHIKKRDPRNSEQAKINRLVCAVDGHDDNQNVGGLPREPVGSIAGSIGYRHKPGASIWVVNHYAAFPSNNQREGRRFALARHLSDHGWDASIIASGTSHPSGERHLPWWQLHRSGVEDRVRFLWLRTPAYRANGLSGVLNMLAFSVSALLPNQTSSLQKPELVVGSTVHPFAAWAALRIARRKGVPFIHKTRDVWPDLLIDLGHWRLKGLPTRAIRRLMTHLVRQSIFFMSPLRNLPLYLRDIGEPNIRFLWISNGTEDSGQVRTDPPPPAPFVFAYFGAHGTANALDRLIDGFDLFLRNHPTIDARLQLVGDGPLKAEPITRARFSASVTCIEFIDRVPRDKVLVLAARAHCLVAAVGNLPVYRFGISLNKAYYYVLLARPIILRLPVEPSPWRWRMRELHSGVRILLTSHLQWRTW